MNGTMITVDRDELIDAVRLLFALERDERWAGMESDSPEWNDVVLEMGHALKAFDDLVGVQAALAPNGPVEK